MAAIYGVTFGVELTMNNILTTYYFDNFGVPLRSAGLLAFAYGFTNIFARPVGGILSDRLAKPFGMPARLWTLWSLHACGKQQDQYINNK